MNELRLHLADQLNKEAKESPNRMSPDVALALQHFHEINSDPKRWASLDMSQFENHRVVRLNIGMIHSDGSKESHIVSRNYTVVDGKVVISIQVHA